MVRDIPTLATALRRLSGRRGSVPVELFAALKVGQKKFGWSESHFKEMIGWPEKYEEEIVYEEKVVAK